MGYKLVKTTEFLEEYLGVMSYDLFNQLTEREFEGLKYSIIDNDIYDEIIKKKQERQRKWDKLNKCAELNNKGLTLEKKGEIQAAIEIYEKNISGDCYPARNSFDRLMVLYRKLKDYDNEQRVILKAISIFKKEDKYKIRLNKVKKLLNK